MSQSEVEEHQEQFTYHVTATQGSVIVEQPTAAELFARFPGAMINHDNKDIYAGWLRREFRLNRCLDCGLWRHPPRAICPRCWSLAVKASVCAGEGHIAMLTYVHYGTGLSDVDLPEGGHPVCVVDLREQSGLRYTSALVGPGAYGAQIGDKVELVWVDRDGAPFPAFRVATESSGEEG